MRQVLQNLRTGETTVAEVPIPTAQRGMVLVQTAASLVSAGTERMVVDFAGKSLLGKARARPDLVRQILDKARREGVLTTLEAAFNRLDQPMPLGYASAGTIVRLGEGVREYRVGQRVACAGGGYAVHADMVVVPQNLLALLPDPVDFEQAAFATLGAIALHGFRLAEAQLGERVAVIGLGLLGLLAVGIAQAAGCAVLGVDLDPRRVELAQGLGAKAVLRPAAVEAATSFTQGRGCDMVLICADTPSADPVELAGTIARDRARVVAVGAVGLQLPRKVYYEKELSFIVSRSYGPGRYDPAYEEGGQDYPAGYVRWTEGRNLQAFVDLLASGRLDVRPLITHRYSIERAKEAYDLISGKGQEPFLGVVLTYDDGRRTEDERRTTDDEGRTTEERIREAAYRPEVVKLGVLGAGNFASAVLLPAIDNIPHLEKVGVASAAGLSARREADRHGFRYASGDETRVLNDPEVNTVAILTRHNLHARQVLAALSAGKHVFCEKPLALNEEELRQVEERLSDISHQAFMTSNQLPVISEQSVGDDFEVEKGITGRWPLVTVGFNRRFAPLAQRLKAFLSGRQEPMVAHYRVNAGYLPPTHWLNDLEQGGGRIIGEGCHFVDFLTFLVGEPPDSVRAQGLPDGGRYCEDNVVLTFSFPDGSLGTVTYLANGDRSFPKERVEAFAGGRVGVLDDYRSLELVTGGKREVQRARLRQDKGHRGEWEAFVAAIQAGGPPPIPYHHLSGVTRATFAAVQALRSGERVAIQPSAGG